MIRLDIQNETSPLEQVVLGTAQSNGPLPLLEDIYDPKSREHLLAGTYPKESDMIAEINSFSTALTKHGVKVERPRILEDCNQIFARDTGFVIEDYFFRSNILPLRDSELAAFEPLLNQIAPEKIITFPEHVHVEGGDVILDGAFIYVGYYDQKDYPSMITARTNIHAVNALQVFFPNKKVIGFELKKSNTNAYETALHLDCCFQPVGTQYAIIHPEGFLDTTAYKQLVQRYGKENIFHVNQQEMYEMNCNVFSIAPDLVISDPSFDRLNNWLFQHKIQVEEVSYQQVGKQGGLFRCSTLPLKRKY